MRHYDWLSSSLSDSLPLLAPPAQNHAHKLPSQSSYRTLAAFFRQHPAADSVLLVDASHSDSSKLSGVISRSRWQQWRSQRFQWRQVLDWSLMAVEDWWQAAQRYLLIDQDLPLSEAIELILARSTAESQEPIVLQTPEGFSLCHPQPLLMAHSRWQMKPNGAASPEVETLRRQHQLILNAIGEGVYGVDLQGNATFINPAAAQMIGWSDEDLIGRSMHQVLHHSRADCTPYPREQCPIYAAFQDGIVHRVAEEVFWRKDGSSFPVEYISTPMRDERGKLIGAVVAFRDITPRKWAEAVLQQTNEALEQIVRDRTTELRQANHQLKELSEVRSRVVSMVCHEFRNPLNTILLSVSSLGRYDAQLTRQQKEAYLRGIEDNVERMTQMIDAVLIIGKIDAKRIEVQPSTFDLIDFCQRLIAEIQPDRPQSRIKFGHRCQQLPITIDQQLLRSILTNLLSNALRYSPESTPVQFKLSKQKQQIRFQIKDRGLGIPPDDLPHVFEPFHRGRNVSNISGTGLGLNIVKRFVDLQQGKIEVESQLGVGTTFTIILPQAAAPEPMSG
jgi:PAS domain S-box-containing protein